MLRPLLTEACILWTVGILLLWWSNSFKCFIFQPLRQPNSWRRQPECLFMPKEEDSSKNLTQPVRIFIRYDPPMWFFFLLIKLVSISAAPLKGIPKAPFRSPTAPSMFSPPSNRTPIAPARTPLRKERGVKVVHHFHTVLSLKSTHLLKRCIFLLSSCWIFQSWIWLEQEEKQREEERL